MTAANVEALVENQRVALHHHHIGAQIANIDEHCRLVALILAQGICRFPGDGGVELAGLNIHIAQAVGDIINEILVRRHQRNHGGQFATLDTHGRQRLFAVIHAEPRGRGMNNAVAAGFFRQLEASADILRCNMRIRPG